ncbi:DNA adenine methylase [Phaeobacter gallaeciensis]|uniref:site-specific DNA-methyltransferase (adenine-specific) n=1 Tax=Phaeobacter gallaeciensis TaxID=60890 RepID=A0ABD4XFU6_9RHOB|nr:DNA adenine methylase [Phaeobacter gallaeciensis]MDE4144834.1 DNA adenine methylase [Phaeobacter gallaeciensis]MDE4159719.1 DNA adenine methylase [Phaeobacter gallaeciensis]MDE4163940.1 DNA adenine methylase [Phaeobacter gallaeciensis]MDE4168179.1 DNA adenine methylase [Phaeobacter gallaeciensis]MDE4169776.1 DNA adenine methylase [Phaeobacter gallaeciensis]
MQQPGLRIVKDGVHQKSKQSLAVNFPAQLSQFPELRYMGSKKRLLPWIHDVFSNLDFETALDPFSGSGSVAYLLKSMGKRTISSDFLNLSSTLAKALIENGTAHLDGPAMKRLLAEPANTHHFIEETFDGVFFTKEDLRFLDRISCNLRQLDSVHQQALAMAALMRSCVKRQPRGVFTISGDLSKYDDGRRDLRLSIEEHFFEQVEVYNEAVFANGRRNKACRSDAFEVDTRGVDLVYLDPPYVPRADDNCYIKRYHFLEGLSCYWQGLDIDFTTKVRKIPKRFTPFSYRKQAVEAFERLFLRFQKQKIVLSYSSNGFPDLDQLTEILHQTKSDVRVFKRDHTYHFGTHRNVKRSAVEEYLIVGQ